MNKAVMASIQPYYVFLIIARLMGWNIPQDKKVEVRKDFPKDKAWNKKAHIYCSKNKKSFNRIPKEYQPLMRPFLGKVIGEFVCDYIDECLPDYNPITGKFFNYHFYDKIGNGLEDCLTDEELVDYGKGKPLYGWQISDLKIYDKPKELSEFRKPLNCGNYDCCVCHNWDRVDLKCIAMNNVLTRPPQSWCYVEEFDV
ncbi:MAG TPA: hypothetical protein PKV66_00430 [Candidatus Pelethenecus sp.]|nr:hypothetical protein [Candidatus Pelethenecus sp.]